MEFVDRNVRASGCDHTFRFSSIWASPQGIDWDQLRDAFERQGAFCDCEVAANMGEGPLAYVTEVPSVDQGNPWLLPPNFVPGSQSTVNKFIFSKAAVGQNTHTKDGEWLVPAPADAKPRKRVRKLVHFFNGVESGLPCEVGVVQEVAPISIA